MRSGNTEDHSTEQKQLAESLSRRLAAYALAATATAGLGLTAAVAPAEASIISHTTSVGLSCPMPETAQLDFSITKSFQLDFRDRCVSGPFFGALSVTPTPFTAGSVAASASRFGPPVAARLGKGSPIGPQQFYDTGGPANRLLGSLGGLVSSKYFFRGNWAPSSPFSSARTARGYLGFEFGPMGGEHFGWVAMSVVPSGWFAAHITGYAYDTVAGQTIKAGQTSTVPEPGTLSMLALGAAGLIALRKRKLSATSRQAQGND